MKLTVKQIRDGIRQLQRLLIMELPATVSFVLMENFAELEPIAQRSDRQHMDVIEKYAATDDEGELKMAKDCAGNEQIVFDAPADKKQYQSEWDSILELEIETNITPISLASIADYNIPGSLLNTWLFKKQ